MPRSTTWDPPPAAGPTFSRITIDRHGALAIEGRGTPGIAIELRTKSRVLGQATSDSNGDWRTQVSRPLDPGVYEISSLAKPARDQSVSGDDVRISIPDRITDDIVIGFNGQQLLPRDTVRDQAERMARDASDRFSQIVPSSETGAQAPKSSAGADERNAPQADWSANAVMRWLERSARAYQSEVIRRLEKSAPPPAEAPSEVAAPKQEDRPEAAPRAAQVEPVAPPADADQKRLEAERRETAELNRLADEATARVAENKRRQLEKARAEAEAKKRQQETAAAQARQLELQKAAELRKAEAKRLADEAARKDQERKRLAEEASRAAKRRQAEDIARRASELAERQAKKTEQDIEADQIAADVKRRKEEARNTSTDKEAVSPGDSDSKRASAAPRARDLRPAEGSAEDASESVAKPEPASFNARPRKCRGPKIRYVEGRRMYLVRPGDTLWTIAERFYGDGVLFPIVYNANRELLSDPDVIIDCKRLFLPKRKNVDPSDFVIHEAMTTVVPAAPAAAAIGPSSH